MALSMLWRAFNSLGRRGFGCEGSVLLATGVGADFQRRQLTGFLIDFGPSYASRIDVAF
jgi:hypothetical protein